MIIFFSILALVGILALLTTVISAAIYGYTDAEWPVTLSDSIRSSLKLLFKVTKQIFCGPEIL